MSEAIPFLAVKDLVKNFGGVQALKGVDLDVVPGEIHGLVGANGAGKSTLIRCLAGLIEADGGSILLDNAPVHIADPQEARSLGLSFIHQELNFVPKFSALQNMLLGLPKPTRGSLIDWNAARKQVEPTAARLGFTFQLDTPTHELTVAEQWLISIGRALLHKSRLIAMDEPTASLSIAESERLFRIIRELSAEGISILYVSHRLDEILDLCDRVTVFRDGARVLSTQRKGLTKSLLVNAIVGSEVEPANRTSSSPPDLPIILEVHKLKRGHIVRDVSFSLHEGEVLGLAGLVGSGRTELVRMIFGADKLEAGEIFMDGRPVTIHDPHDAVRQGIALIPEERRSQGLLLGKTVSFNINLPTLKGLRHIKWMPFINLKSGNSRAKSIVNRLQVKTGSVHTPVSNLSGGNQQKVVIGKWLTQAMRVIILDEPSRGVDVGARGEIHSIVRSLAADGAGVIVISSEMEELPGLCDRVLVMVEGRIVGVLVGAEITKEALLQLSYAHVQETGEIL
jgi:ribose transport system ATP-binding protein